MKRQLSEEDSSEQQDIPAISPYLFFWQSNQEVEEEISKGRTSLRLRKGATNKE